MLSKQKTPPGCLKKIDSCFAVNAIIESINYGFYTASEKEAIALITESFKGLSLSSYRFYLVILPLNIKWALMKYHIKPLGITKTQAFRQDLCEYDLP